MGDQGTLIITLGKGMYYREEVAKVSTGKGKENWWAGATVNNQAAEMDAHERAIEHDSP